MLGEPPFVVNHIPLVNCAGGGRIRNGLRQVNFTTAQPCICVTVSNAVVGNRYACLPFAGRSATVYVGAAGILTTGSLKPPARGRVVGEFSSELCGRPNILAQFCGCYVCANSYKMKHLIVLLLLLLLIMALLCAGCLCAAHFDAVHGGGQFTTVSIPTLLEFPKEYTYVDTETGAERTHRSLTQFYAPPESNGQIRQWCSTGP